MRGARLAPRPPSCNQKRVRSFLTIGVILQANQGPRVVADQAAGVIPIVIPLTFMKITNRLLLRTSHILSSDAKDEAIIALAA